MKSNGMKSPFDRYLVFLLRVESGDVVDERFWVWEIDLPNDNIGPRTFPQPMPEAALRERLRECGLDRHDIDARIAFARQWATTWTLPVGQDPTAWRAHIQTPETIDEVLVTMKRGRKFRVR
jgi:hypothetical protein